VKFIDTSVLVAAAHQDHPFFELSHAFLAACKRAETGLAAHGVVETYSALTRMPKPFGYVASEAAAYVARLVQSRLQVFALPEAEILELIAEAPDRGILGGRIYDALHARTAKQAGARAIVTWNTKHFAGLEMELRVETP
jgi:predicted nucleic acid-binding protein